MNTLEKSLEGLNLLRQESFESEINDPIIVIDKTHIPGFVRQTISIGVYNVSDSTLYFKILEQIPNWVIDPTGDVPLDGKLGAISPGEEKHFEGVILADLPLGESEDTGNFVVEAYTDAGYVNLIESHSHPTTIYIEDLESWANVQKWDFDDGSAQGWTLDGMNVDGSYSVDVPGYCLRKYYNPDGGLSWRSSPFYMSKSIIFPNTNKLRLSFYFRLVVTSQSYGAKLYLSNLQGFLDDEKIFDCYKPEEGKILYILVTVGECPWSRDSYWVKTGFDISEYKGSTKTVKISGLMWLYSRDTYGQGRILFDNIVVAGK